MPSREHKVALIGSDGYNCATEGIRVVCFPWAYLHDLQNLKDFDTVLINLLGPKKDLAEKIDWEYFNTLLNFETAVDILRNDGKIIIVGDPRLHSYGSQPFLYWTGLDFEWETGPGDTVITSPLPKHYEYANYAKYLKQWKYSLKTFEIDTFRVGSYIENLSKYGKSFAVEADVVCQNRYKRALIFTINYEISQRRNSMTNVLKTFGPIIFLPEISQNEDETLQIVLRDLCEVEANLPEPKWILKYTAPGQSAADNNIITANAEVAAANAKLEKATFEKEKIRRCLKLLYEREFALEPVVRDTLRSLGAKVEEPVEKNKEDGWIEVTIDGALHNGVLEIKNTKGDQFGEDGRKQLLDWIDRGRTMRHKKYKGIFIGNSAVNKPFNERPEAFNANWSKAAKLSDICAMKTEDLYIVHLLNEAGQIDTSELWKDIFQTNGVFDIKKYKKLLKTQV